MPYELQPLLSTGEIAYIQKHNSNYSVIEAALNGLAAQMLAANGAALSAGATFESLFGIQAALIGAASYVPTPSGSNLNVSSGYFWRPSTAVVVSKPSSSTLSFTGVAAGTYYLQIDTSGTPTRSSDPSEAAYSVVWSGSSFGAVTRLARLVWSSEEWHNARTSAALGASYDTLDARLEVSEAKAVLGELARTWQTGRLSLSVAGGANVTLTATQANNTILDFTGALTANISVIVPLGTNPRMWAVTNNTTGAYTLTVRGSTGIGVAVPQGGRAVLGQDGTNVIALTGAGTGGVDSVAGKTGTVTLVAADLGDFAEAVDDRVGALLAGVGLTVTYDDAGNVLTVSLPAQPFDASAFYPGLPSASAILLRVPIARAVTFPANFADSRGSASANATGSTAFDIQKNGASVGTMTFPAGASTATFTSSGGAAVNFAAGDYLSVIAPGTPDATLANVGLVLAGTR